MVIPDRWVDGDESQPPFCSQSLELIDPYIVAHHEGKPNPLRVRQNRLQMTIAVSVLVFGIAVA